MWLPQSHIGLSRSHQLCIVSAQRPWPVRRRFSTDRSCLGSYIPITPWLGSGIKVLFDIVDSDHSSRQHLTISNPAPIRSLAVFQGGFLDFSLSVGTSSSLSANNELFLSCAAYLIVLMGFFSILTSPYRWSLSCVIVYRLSLCAIAPYLGTM